MNGISVKCQMPGNGCGNCGKWADEIQSIKRKRLRRYNDAWLCVECIRDEKRNERGE